MRTVPALIHAHCTSLEKKHATRPHTRKIAFYFKPYLYRLYLHIGFMRDDAGVEVLEILPGTQPRGGTERVPPSQFHCSIVFFLICFLFQSSIPSLCLPGTAHCSRNAALKFPSLCLPGATHYSMLAALELLPFSTKFRNRGLLI